MITVYYIFSILFIWMNAYYFININKLDIRFKYKDKSSLTKTQLFYYLTKVLYWIWIPLGLLTDQYHMFILLIILGGLRFPFYHINNKLFKIYNLLLPVISIIVIFVTILYHFFI